MNAVTKHVPAGLVPVSAPKLQIDIEGMTCASCVALIEKSLKAAPGVFEASINLATVRAAAGAVDVSARAKAVADTGYKARAAIGNKAFYGTFLDQSPRIVRSTARPGPAVWGGLDEEGPFASSGPHARNRGHSGPRRSNQGYPRRRSLHAGNPPDRQALYKGAPP